MAMDRRDFLKLCGAAGLVASAPALLPRRAHAQDDAAEGPFWVFVHASGGWDPTSLCDPKGRASEDEENPMNHYFTADIGEAGNIRYAPVGENQVFFDKHFRRTMVINGVDTQTNNHDAGVRHTWSGKLSEGYPALAALLAGQYAAEKPMAFITNGGYDYTGGLVAPTRVGNIDAVGRIAWPNSIEGRAEGESFHSPATYDRIKAALDRRQATLHGQFDLPRYSHAISQLYDARAGQNTLRRLTEVLPGEFSRDNLPRQAQVCCAAFKAGISRAANLSVGGFDTHGNHDDSHIPRLGELLRGVDFLWDEAERQGIADDLIVMIGSDFGRTPGYNSGNGKDHWAITSVVLMGKGIPGNTVIGSTDERHVPIKVDPRTLAPAAEGAGVRIEPQHIHRALRRLAGFGPDDETSRLFPLLGAGDLPLLGA